MKRALVTVLVGIVLAGPPAAADGGSCPGGHARLVVRDRATRAPIEGIRAETEDGKLLSRAGPDGAFCVPVGDLRWRRARLLHPDYEEIRLPFEGGAEAIPGGLLARRWVEGTVQIVTDEGLPAEAVWMARSIGRSKPIVETLAPGAGFRGAVGLEGERAWFAAWSKGTVPTCRFFESLPARLDPIVLSLRKPAAVEVVVLDEEERPVAGGVELAWVGDRAAPNCPPAELSPSPEVPHSKAGSRGAFVLDGIPPGPGELEVRAKGFLPARIGPLELASGQRVSAGTVRLGRGVPVEGRVVSPSGEGLSAVLVVAVREEVEVRRTRTDPAGRFLLVLPPGGAVDLLVGEPPAPTERIESVRPGENPIEVRLAASPGISGRILNLEGVPVSGALVQAVPWLARWSEASGRELREARSGEDGRFRLDRVGEGIWRVRVLAQGYAPLERSRVAVDEHGTAPLELVVQEAATLDGRVLDRDGGPVAGASVRLGGDPAGPREALTAEDGRFHLEGLPRGLVRIEAEHPAGGWGWVETNPAAGTVEIVLEPVGSIEGRATGAQGEPLGGREVRLEPFGRKTMTDPDGAFRFERVPSGRCRVSLWKKAIGESEVLEVRNLALAPGEVAQVVFDGRGLLRGTFTVQDSPAAGARVSLTRLEGERASGNPPESVASVRTEPDGSFLFEGLRPGVYVLSGTSKGLVASRTVRLSRAEEIRADLVVRGALVEGTVLDETDGRPIEGARVDAFDRNRTWGIVRHEVTMPDGSTVETVQLDGAAVGAVTDRSGRFEIVLPAGRFRIQVSARGYRRKELDLEISEKGERVDVRLGRVYRLAGIVLDEFGAAVPGALLGASCRGGSFSSLTRSDVDGLFEFGDLLPGSCVVVAGARASAAVFEADPAMPGELNREVRLQPTGSLEVVFEGSAEGRPELLTPSGIPLGPLLRHVVGSDDPPPRRVVEGDRVRWVWDALPAGSYGLVFAGANAARMLTIRPGEIVSLEASRP